jgi:hypothetical protein
VRTDARANGLSRRRRYRYLRCRMCPRQPSGKSVFFCTGKIAIPHPFGHACSGGFNSGTCRLVRYGWENACYTGYENNDFLTGSRGREVLWCFAAVGLRECEGRRKHARATLTVTRARVLNTGDRYFGFPGEKEMPYVFHAAINFPRGCRWPVRLCRPRKVKGFRVTKLSQMTLIVVNFQRHPDGPGWGQRVNHW